MKNFLVFFSFIYISYADIIDNSFITNYEYGAMLYENPRGIGCIKCHGDSGKGGIIAYYKNDDGKMESLSAPSIVGIDFISFRKKLENKTNSSDVMPTYYLTEQEVESIYFYLNKKNEKESKK